MVTQFIDKATRGSAVLDLILSYDPNMVVLAVEGDRALYTRKEVVTRRYDRDVSDNERYR